MKLKQRIKQALFGFFKEEIMKAFVPADGMPHFTGTIYNPNTQDVILHQIGCVIDFEQDKYERMPSEYAYEKACDKARKDLFNEFIKHIKIDGQVLIDPVYYHKKRIVLHAWVGREREIKI